MLQFLLTLSTPLSFHEPKTESFGLETVQWYFSPMFTHEHLCPQFGCAQKYARSFHNKAHLYVLHVSFVIGGHTEWRAPDARASVPVKWRASTEWENTKGKCSPHL